MRSALRKVGVLLRRIAEQPGTRPPTRGDDDDDRDGLAGRGGRRDDPPDDAAAIRGCLLDYFEGWFEGDAARMDRALHPGLAKHALGQGPDRSDTLDLTTKDEMVEATRQGRGRSAGPSGPRDPDRHRQRLGRYRERDRPFGGLRRVRAPGQNHGRLADHRDALALGRRPWSTRRLSARPPRRRRPPGVGPREQMRARYPDVEGFVERDGVRVAYEVYGEGEPTILFVPTWHIIHSRFWKLQIPYLARHGRVVTFDPRGNGRSDRPTTPRRTPSRVRRRLARGHGRHRRPTGPCWSSLSMGAQRALHRRGGAPRSRRGASSRSARPADRSEPRERGGAVPVRRARWRPTRGGPSTTPLLAPRLPEVPRVLLRAAASRSRTRRSRSRTASAGGSRRRRDADRRPSWRRL